jgi:hypothetical protein
MMDSTTGGAGVGGCGLIITGADTGEVHPAAVVTVKVYVLSPGSPVMVLVVPVPMYVFPPGVLVMV